MTWRAVLCFLSWTCLIRSSSSRASALGASHEERFVVYGNASVLEETISNIEEKVSRQISELKESQFLAIDNIALCNIGTEETLQVF